MLDEFLLSKKPVLLSTCYLAPVEYYFVLANSNNIIIEQYENYCKQSYRNRCRILGSNGIIDLTIPVEKYSNEKTLMKDVRISEHNNWQLQHWKSIQSAYNSSPFFEYIIDDLVPFYKKKWKFIIDFNIEFQAMICEFLDIKSEIKLTNQYENNINEDFLDVRELIHPKREPTIKLLTYYQVFEHKFEFIPNLSIVDLIFNMGNESQLIIKKSGKKIVEKSKVE